MTELETKLLKESPILYNVYHRWRHHEAKYIMLFPYEMQEYRFSNEKRPDIIKIFEGLVDNAGLVSEDTYFPMNISTLDELFSYDFKYPILGVPKAIIEEYANFAGYIIPDGMDITSATFIIKRETDSGVKEAVMVPKEEVNVGFHISSEKAADAQA